MSSSSAPPPKLRRLHDLDAMRSILMMLGVVLHAANPYRPGGTWLVHDLATSQSLTWLVEVIHLFRMPAFFVVAGFFAMHSLMRRDTNAFLAERLVRLMVPFVATLVTLNLVQTWLLLPSPRSGGAMWEAVLTAWENGRLMGHLWFLLNLSIYCVVVAALANPLRRFAILAWPRGARTHAVVRGIVVTAVVVGLAVSVVDYLGPDWLHSYVVGLFEPVELMEYSVFFVAGLILYGRSELLTSFTAPGLVDLAAGIAAVAALVLIRSAESRPAAVVEILAHWTIVWTTVRICFAAFRRWASRPSPAFVYLSDASYTVYLFHHIVVILVARALLDWNAAAWTKFMVVAFSAALATLLIHHFLILRFATLRLLFNGTRKPFKPLPAQ